MPPPVWLMRQAGRYLPEYREIRSHAGTFLDLCYAPDLAIEATLQPVRRFSLDAAIVFSDILLVPHALGQEVSFSEGKGPKLAALKQSGDLKGLVLEDVATKLRPVYEAIKQLHRELAPEIALIGFAGAPWTLAAYMIEGKTSRHFSKAQNWAKAEPQSFSKLIDVLVEAVSGHLIRQVEAGADVVQIFDSWAGVLSPEAFERWVVQPTRAIVGKVKEAVPGTPVIGFPRGVDVLYKDYAEASGVDGVSIDTQVSPAWAAAELQDKVCVQGNLDPEALVEGGKRMRDATAQILEALGSGPFVFNLGHGVVPQTPPEHVSELLETIRGAV
ncbi:MAG: uroporphyrinogen decarboxylase [Alphaproteobacteria bacterium]|nr:uroporphyrinogen decarboxylase [Alphaproteobacteria bacterium]